MYETAFVELIKKQKNIIIYGAGMVGELVCKRITKFGLLDKVVAVAVTKQSMQSELFGLSIREIGDCIEFKENTLVIVATFGNLHTEMKEQLDTLGFKNILLVDQQLYRNMTQNYIKEFKQTKKIKKTKIDVLLMASDNNSSSGAFLCMIDLAKELRKNNIKTLIILPLYGTGERLLEEQKLEYWFVESEDWVLRDEDDLYEKIFKINSNKKAIEELEDIIKEHEVSLVHNNTTYTYVGAVAACGCCVPLVWHLREYIYAQGCQFMDEERAIAFINNSDKILCTSNFIASCMKDIKKDVVQVVYDGIDVQNYYINNKKIFKDSSLHFVIVGSVNPLKNQKELLEAATQLKESGIVPFDITIVGDGDKEYIADLKMYVHQNNLEENVFFVGRQKDVKFFYEKADIAIVCSKAEAFGRTTIEAQLAGCLVIGASAGATKELLIDGVTGFLYESGNASALKEIIVEVYEAKDNMKKIAIQGQKRAFKTYTKEMNASKIMDVYKQLGVGEE